jgi:hypothetical protein
MNLFSNSHISDAITAAQNESLDQYSAAGGIATEALNAIRTVSALNAQPLFLSKSSHTVALSFSHTLLDIAVFLSMQ